MYYIPKEDIPAWELWSLDVKTPVAGWRDATNATRRHELAHRTFAGAAASAPG